MRLFLAVNLPEQERGRLHDETAPLREARLPVRWVAAKNFHLTLRFLGSVRPALVAAIRIAGARAAEGVAAFSVPIAGIGAFPDTRRPRVVWVGVGDAPPLQRLHSALAHALAPLGFPPERRPFQPHITLGRVHAHVRPRELAGLRELAGTIRYEGVLPVRSVDLMRSEPGRAGARYERIGTAPLG